MDTEGFGDEEVRDDYDWKREEQDEASEEATGFDGDEHEVREGASGDQKSAVEVGGDGLVRCRRRAVAFRYRREVPFRFR